MKAFLRQTRVRLALAYSGIFSVVAFVASAALIVAIASVTYSSIDDRLDAAARALRPTALTDLGQALSGGVGGSSSAVGVSAYLFRADGVIFDRTPDGPSAADLVPAARLAAASGGPIRQSPTVDGMPQRVRAEALQAPGGGTRVLVLVRSLGESNHLVATTASVLLVGMAVLMISATVLGYGLAGTALRPVREITAAARALSDQDLHRRIELDLPGDEMGDLADTFNKMLERLEVSFDSLRRFTADAAHELRAPLTLIRTEAEVSLKRTRTPEEYQASLSAVLSEAKRLGRMADQLLMLARAEAGALVIQVTDLDPSDLVAETLGLWMPLATERKIELIAEPGPRESVRGDSDLLRRLLDNLIDNAMRHSNPHGRVLVSSRRSGDTWELTVEDSGAGVPEAAKASIFERFSRADTARGRDTGGAGLGLALCRAIAGIHHGTISLEDSLSGARFVVRLPIDGRGVGIDARSTSR